jgi:hypothetical protein
LSEKRKAMSREEFLTVRWNNLLSLVMGLIPLTYVVVVLSTSALSPGAAFTGLMIIGVVY